MDNLAKRMMGRPYRSYWEKVRNVSGIDQIPEAVKEYDNLLDKICGAK